MSKLKIKAPNNSMNLKQYILSDFIPEFSEFRRSEDNSRFGCKNMDKNLIRIISKGKTIFKDKIPVCPKCNSKKVYCDGKRKRKLIFLNKGEQKVLVERYECKKCGHKFDTDLTSIVKPNSNITIPIIEYIKRTYRNFSGSLHSIRKQLNEEYNVVISHQSIENIILGFDTELKFPKWSLSGYYCFDSLWVKKNGIWKYLLVLFDSKLNTIVSYKLADSEKIEVIYKFLTESLANQPKISITTDLKREYRVAIDKINIKHVFCRFHTKQSINKRISDYLKQNKVSSEEFDSIKSFKQEIFNLLDSETIENAKLIRDKFISLNKDVPEVIYKILWDFIIPEFKKLTYAIENRNIEATNNKLENCFQKIFPKPIKRINKSEDGILTRFGLKLNNWNLYNSLC